MNRYKEELNINGPLKRADTPMVKEDIEAQHDEPGAGWKTCQVHIGGLLFLVRSSRPECSFAVGFLSRFVSRWTVASDKRLRRIFEYLASTMDYGVEWWLDPAEFENLQFDTWVDADHAGCMDTARSTTGWNAFIDGTNTNALVDWSSKRQQAAERSTGGSEHVAGADCVQSTLPLLSATEQVFQQKLLYTLHTDSDSARSSFQSGYSRKLRYLKKNQRVSVAFVADALAQIGGRVAREDSERNSADLHTKPLERVLFHRHRAFMGVTQFS